MRTVNFLLIALLIAALLTAGCVATSYRSEPRSSNGFWSQGRQQNLNERYRLGIELPLPEADFLRRLQATNLTAIEAGRPKSAMPVIPPPRLDRDLDVESIDRAWILGGGYRDGPPPFNELYYAYVIDGKVVSVENRHGYYD